MPEVRGGRARDGSEQLGDAEVHHLDATVGQTHDILGLEIAMDDRWAVRVGDDEGARDLVDDVGDFGPGQGAAGLQSLAQRPTLEPLEHHDQLLVDLRARQAADDPRVVEVGEDAHLGDELLAPVLTRIELGARQASQR